MAGPPYVDDVAIPDSAVLWRRIPPAWVVPDENHGGRRVTSAAFDDSRDGSPLSVLLAYVVFETDRGPENVLCGFAGYGLASITAGDARRCDQGVMATPLPDEPAHASVFGRKTKAIRKRLADGARWVIAPPGS